MTTNIQTDTTPGNSAPPRRYIRPSRGAYLGGSGTSQPPTGQQHELQPPAPLPGDSLVDEFDSLPDEWSVGDSAAVECSSGIEQSPENETDDFDIAEYYLDEPVDDQIASGIGELAFIARPAGRGKGATATVTAFWSGEPIENAEIELGKPAERDMLITALIVKQPAIDRDDAARKLLNAAATLGQRSRGEGGTGGKSQATQLIELADDVELFHDGQVAYARFTAGDEEHCHYEVSQIRSEQFKNWIAY